MFIVASAVLLLLRVGAAKAADPAQLADTGGFLLGNAHRCGVPAKRVGHAEKVIYDMIATISRDQTEQAAADRRYVKMFAATAFPDRAISLVPPCATVIAQFERLERHHRQSGVD